MKVHVLFGLCKDCSHLCTSQMALIGSCVNSLFEGTEFIRHMGRVGLSLVKKYPFQMRHLRQSSKGKQHGETCQDPAWFLAMTVVALLRAALVQRPSHSSPASKAPTVTRAVLPQQTLADTCGLELCFHLSPGKSRTTCLKPKEKAF